MEDSSNDGMDSNKPMFHSVFNAIHGECIQKMMNFTIFQYLKLRFYIKNFLRAVEKA